MLETPAPIRFGFLNVNWEISFECGRVVPIPEFEKTAKLVERRLNRDGYLYPPTVKTVTCDADGRNGRTIPKTKRPAHLHCVIPSHDLFILPAKEESNLREGSAGFVIHTLAFLFQTRLQFADWYIDGRIPIRKHRGISEIVANSSQAGNHLSNAYGIWSAWRESERRRFLNILYMFSRTPAYEWDWEEFLFEYMVLDACWKMGKELFGFHSKFHKDRPLELCEKFSIPHQQFIDLTTMVTLRNDLFHETLWHGGRPGSSHGSLPYHLPMRMRMLNEAIIAAFMGMH